MGALSDDQATALLNALFNGASLGTPSTYYVALSTTEPNDDGTGVTEPSTGAASYARVAVTRNTTNFPTTSTRSISNALDITFPTPGTGEDWGVIGWYALYSAATAGTFHGWGAFGDTVHVTEASGECVIDAGVMVIYAPGS